MLLDHTVRLARLDMTLLLRNRTAAFTALAMPLLFAGFAVLSRGGEAAGVPSGLFVLTGTLGLAAVLVVFMNLTAVFTARREDLSLKRMRGSVMSEAAIFGGSGLTALAVCLVQTIAMVGVGMVALGGRIPANIPLLLLAVALGAVMFVPLAAALSGVTKTAESAQFTVLPGFLILVVAAQVGFPLDGAPEIVQRVAGAMPLSPVVEIIRTAYFGLEFTVNNPSAIGFGESWLVSVPEILKILAWTAAGVMLARRYFRWEPRNA